MNKDLKKVGFWYDPLAASTHLPHPQDLVNATWAAEEKKVVIAHLKAGEVKASCLGMSRCRFCNKFNGNKDLTDGVWVWPEGFAHYLEEHCVRPPQDFIDHVLKRTDGARRAALRSPGYEQMSARDQWEEDKALGILDWDGD